MRTLRLHDGTALPALGLGTWKSRGDDLVRAVRTALDAGYRHIDCAAIYGNEDVVGRALSDAFASGGVRRDEVWITSKLWNGFHAPGDVRPALERTLADLRLDRLDLYLVHWPVALRPGLMMPSGPADLVSLDEMPLEATWEAMAKAADAGLSGHVGVSNFSAAKVRRVHEATGVLPAVNQVEMHPYLAQEDLLAESRELGVLVTAYSPLGTPDSGEMFGRKDPWRLLDDPVVARIARERSATPAQVLLAWALARGTAVIPKSTHEGRIRENLAAGELDLTSADLDALASLDRRHRYVDGSFWCPEGSPYSLASLWDE